MTRSLSAAGLEQLILEEGEVLRAYQDVKGVWTIGVGLTAASGVIKPVKGMVITRADSRALLSWALQRSYEPVVNQRMRLATQTEFDGAVSFHFNTGEIDGASWVDAWLRGARAEIRPRLALWNKSGGRVIAGLVTRRAREADLIVDGAYDPRVLAAVKQDDPADVAWTLLKRSARGSDVGELQAGLKQLGFYKGRIDDDFGPVTERAVRAFQEAQDLTVDGKAGRATRTTLFRLLETAEALAA